MTAAGGEGPDRPPAPTDHRSQTGPSVDPEVLEELESWPEDRQEKDEADEASKEGVHPGEAGGRAVPDRPEEPGRAGDRAPGALVVVGTPIGNLGDLAPRAVAALGAADLIYCEDTRHSRKLLTHAGVTGVPLRSLHEYNEVDRMDEVVGAVREGRTVALVSDAGMPGVSDPGSRVIRAVAAAGLTVTVVPGPSAVLAALVGSGLPTDRFSFAGFLPRSGRERRAALAALAADVRTTVLFEAPVRLAATLADLVDTCGPTRPVVVARELTKLHEEFWRGTMADAASWAGSAPVRGEVVVVVGGAPAPEAIAPGDGVLLAALTERLGAGERTRGAVDEVAAAFGVPRRRVYELALAARGDGVGGRNQEGESGPTEPE